MKKIITIALFCGIAGFARAQVIPNNSTVPVSVSSVNPIPSAYGATIKVNFLRTWEASRPFSADTSVVSGIRTLQEVKQVTQYFDGLGRSLQTVSKQISPSGKDLVQPFIYDGFGREVFIYLSYIAIDSNTNNGKFKRNPFNEQASFLNNSTHNPGLSGEQVYYSKSVFEASPLDRVDTSFAPGNSWGGTHIGVVNKHLVNTAADSVRIWTIATSVASSPTSTGYYSAGQLQKDITRDEYGKDVIEYTNKEGQLILRKIQLDNSPSAHHSGWLCTYYIYDNLDQLRCVVQPKGVEARTPGWVLSSTVLNELCFRYEYDNRGRIIIKKVPGAGEVWMVYDARDRLVMSQDSMLRAQGKWLYMQYDALNRPVATGLWTNSSSRYYHEGQGAATTSYPNPGSNYEILTETYYDNYNWVSSSGSGLSSTFINTYASNTNYFYSPSNSSFPYPQSITPYYIVTGQVTGSKTKVLGTGTYLYVANFYDDRGRIIQTHSTNYSGGKDTVTMQYSFSGQLLRSLFCHAKSGTNSQQYKVLTKNEYDAAGRLVKVSKKTGNSTETVIAENVYDESGQLITKRLGNKRDPSNQNTYLSSAIDTLDYSYNIRGWLRGINKNYARAQSDSRWFGMELAYDYGFSQTQFDGNIAGIRWRSKGDGEQRAYGFTYDAASRFLKADFTQNNSGWNTTAGVDFTVKDMSYDGNGNILAMSQTGLKFASSSVIDSLSYGYNPNTNRLHYVTDNTNDADTRLGDFKEATNNTSQDYWYDGNGNLLGDNNKGITGITYNHLNLPTEIKVNGKGSISYIYDAGGSKLAKTTIDSTGSPVKTIVTTYLDGFIYENDTLQFVTTEEGRARQKRSNYSDTIYYDYFLKDHLGNVRSVLTDELRTDMYPAASMELATAEVEETYYGSLEESRVVPGAPDFTTWFPENDWGEYAAVVQRTSTAAPALLLKVMAGDKFSLTAQSGWMYSMPYLPNSQDGGGIPWDLFFAMTDQLAGSSRGKVTSSDLQSSEPFLGQVGAFFDLQNDSTSSSGGTIHSFVNWILFDEQFHVDMTSSGFSHVGDPNVIKTHVRTDLPVRKNGYLFVFLSNTNSDVSVYFDGLQVTHTRGPLVSEEHYYPFGLPMAGISSKALNFGSPENKYKYNGIERENDLSIEIYDAQLRELDGQTGRWWQIDPKIEKMEMWSPYASNYDNPIRYKDPLGDDPDGCCAGLKAWAKQMLNNADRNLGAARDWVVETANQAWKNARTRWEWGATWPQQVLANPLSLMPTPVGFAPPGGGGSTAGAMMAIRTEGTAAAVVVTPLTPAAPAASATGLVLPGTLYAQTVANSTNGNNSNTSSSSDGTSGQITVPEGWTTKPSKKGGGTVYQDPANPHNSIRYMPGNPNSINKAQQNPYIVFKKNGVAHDVNGNALKNADDPAAHIPAELFDINKMPKF